MKYTPTSNLLKKLKETREKLRQTEEGLKQTRDDLREAEKKLRLYEKDLWERDATIESLQRKVSSLEWSIERRLPMPTNVYSVPDSPAKVFIDDKEVVDDKVMRKYNSKLVEGYVAGSYYVIKAEIYLDTLQTQLRKNKITPEEYHSRIDEMISAIEGAKRPSSRRSRSDLNEFKKKLQKPL